MQSPCHTVLEDIASKVVHVNLALIIAVPRVCRRANVRSWGGWFNRVVRVSSNSVS
jgi:hypothetical protein